MAENKDQSFFQKENSSNFQMNFAEIRNASTNISKMSSTIRYLLIYIPNIGLKISNYRECSKKNFLSYKFQNHR